MKQEVNIYLTQNTVLATVLATFGAEFADPKAPSKNCYDADDLKRAGQRASDLEKAGIPGRVIYAFKRSPLLEKLIKSFDRAKAAIAEHKPIEIDFDLDQAVALIAQFQSNRKHVGESWRATSSLVRRSTGDKSCKIVSLNASEEARKEFAR